MEINEAKIEKKKRDKGACFCSRFGLIFFGKLQEKMLAMIVEKAEVVIFLECNWWPRGARRKTFLPGNKRKQLATRQQLETQKAFDGNCLRCIYNSPDGLLETSVSRKPINLREFHDNLTVLQSRAYFPSVGCHVCESEGYVECSWKSVIDASEGQILRNRNSFRTKRPPVVHMKSITVPSA